MRINRRFLYGGVFLVALGAVLVAADLGTLDLAIVRDALRLWPVALVLIGVALIVRRSPIALPAGLLAASVPGLALGGAIAVGPRFITECLDRGAAVPATIREGSFTGTPDISIRAGCGTIRVSSDPAAAGWRLVLDGTSGSAPTIVATDASLAIDSLGAGDWPGFDADRAGWQLTLPQRDLRDVSMALTGTDSQIDLPNVRIETLEVSATASRVRLDLGATTVSELSAKASFGQLSLTVPSGTDLTGDLRITGGELRICTPSDVGLRVTGRGFAYGVTVDGGHRDDLDRAYQSANYSTATHHADLTVNASFGAVEINPIGGCK